MTVKSVRHYPLVPLGEVLVLDRHEVQLQPDETYRIAGIYSFGKGIFERNAILGAATSYSSLFRLEQDQFVFSRLNGWEGAVDIVGPDFSGCLVSSEYPTFKVRPQRGEPSYFRWIARWPVFWDLLRPRGSMVRRKRVQTSQLLEVKIPLPPIEEQQRIAARLEEVERLSSRVRERLDRAGRCLTASRANLVTRPHGDEGWRALPLREVLGLAIDAVPVDADTHYEMAGVYSFGRGLFRRSALLGSTTSYKTLHRLRAGQIVMSRLKAWEGAMALVDAPFEGSYLSPEFPTFDVNDDLLDDRFCEALLTSEPFWIRLKGSSKGIGARKERVNAERLLDVVVELPSLSQQRVIASQLDSLRRVEQLGSRRTRVVAALSRSVMNQEFSSIR